MGTGCSELRLPPAPAAVPGHHAAPGETPAEGGRRLDLHQLSGHQRFRRNLPAAKMTGRGKSGVYVVMPPAQRHYPAKQPNIQVEQALCHSLLSARAVKHQFYRLGSVFGMPT